MVLSEKKFKTRKISVANGWWIPVKFSFSATEAPERSLKNAEFTNSQIRHLMTETII